MINSINNFALKHVNILSYKLYTYISINCQQLLISVGHTSEVCYNMSAVPVIVWLEGSALEYPQIFCLWLCELTEVSIK